jgi:ABC-type uncharacterized transport system involved in gliding motility auxiliary subunit
MVVLGRRQARYGANLALLTALVFGIVVATNYLANRHNKRWDLTEAKQFTLSDQTVKILGNLGRDLEVVILDRSDRARTTRELLEQYRYYSKRVSIEVIDQEAQPARAAQYRTATESNIPFGTIVIDSGDRQERVSSATEQDITNAIIKVLKEGKKTIYFMDGHGERDIEESGPGGASLIKAKLEESNYEVAKYHPLQSMTEGRIELPEDATAIIIAGPQRDYLPAEIDVLRYFLKSAGKIVFLLDPQNQGEIPNLESFMSELGVVVGNNVVIDVSGVGQLLGVGGPESPLIASYGPHAITERMASFPTVYPIVRTVTSAETTPEGVSVTEILESSESSWAEESLDDLASGVKPDEGELTGPLSIAVAVILEPDESNPVEADTDESAGEGGDAEPQQESPDADDEPPPPEGRAIVVGDSDFMANNLVSSPIGNRDLFLNMVNWVAQDEDLISIRPKEAEDRRVVMTQQQQSNVGYLSLLIIPGVILLMGVSVWWGRR